MMRKYGKLYLVIVTLCMNGFIGAVVTNAAPEDKDMVELKPDVALPLCFRIAASLNECVSVQSTSSGSRLMILRAFRNAAGDRTYFEVRTSAGEQGFVDGNLLQAASNGYVVGLTATGVIITRNSALSLPDPQIGMTRAEVIGSSWGSPSKIVSLSTLATLQEDYFYSRGRSLRLINGIVRVKAEQK